jgi:hypothetical protein
MPKLAQGLNTNNNNNKYYKKILEHLAGLNLSGTHSYQKVLERFK